MGAVIELAFSNAIIIQGGRSGSSEAPGVYHIEENRIKGEYNGVQMDIGARAHITDEEYNKLIEVDSEELDMWRLVSVAGYEQNRLVSYPSNYFHSKYPNKSWKEGREVYVMFYKFK